jgi:hypothetical protein
MWEKNAVFEVCENKALRTIFGPKREGVQEVGDNNIMSPKFALFTITHNVKCKSH